MKPKKSAKKVAKKPASHGEVAAPDLGARARAAHYADGIENALKAFRIVLDRTPHLSAHGRDKMIAAAKDLLGHT